MKKIYQILLICVGFATFSPAQQLPLFNQYRQNIGVINPAGISTDFLTYQQTINISGSFRQQWTDIQNAPKTQILQGSYLFDNDEGMSMLSGGYIINDQTGPTGFTGLYGRFAAVFSDDVYERGLAIGINAGIVQYRVDVSKINFLETNDILITEDQTQLYPDVGLGVFAYQRLETNNFLDESQVYAGISVPQTIGLDLEFKDENDQFYTKRVQHFYGVLGLIKYLSDDQFIEPSVWVKYTQNAKVNVNANLRYKMTPNFWIGAGGSSAKALNAEAGLLIGELAGYDNTFTISYGFDYFFNAYGPEAGTTHEFNVGYSF